MIFIIGGSYQGKTECALKRLRSQAGLENGQAGGKPAIFDARKIEELKSLERLTNGQGEQALRARRRLFQEIEGSHGVLHLELLIKRLMEQEPAAENWEEELFSALQDRNGTEKIITADEIGYGIVPLDPFERAYREREGRFCQRVAACAGQVLRVVCGVETRIK